MIRERAAGRRSRASSSAAPSRRRPTPEVLAAIAARARDRDRPVQPARLDRPDPRRAGDARGARAAARAGRRGQPDRRRRGAQGPDGRVHGATPALELSAAGVADFYGELLDGIVADEHVPGLPTLLTDTRMDEPPRARASRARRSTSPALWRADRDLRRRASWLGSRRAHRRDPARQALRARQAAPRRERRRPAAPGARRGDGGRRAGARWPAPRRSRRRSSSRREELRRLGRARAGAIVVVDRPRAASRRPPPLGIERALAEGVERVLCVPGDCPALDPAELEQLLRRGRALPAPGRAGRVVDRPRPPRHRHQRAAARARRTRSRRASARTAASATARSRAPRGSACRVARAPLAAARHRHRRRPGGAARAPGRAARAGAGARAPVLLARHERRSRSAPEPRLSGRPRGASRVRALRGIPEVRPGDDLAR